MSIETKSMHITKVGGNVFADLGFSPEEATTLQAASRQIIAEKLAIKKQLMAEISTRIEENRLLEKKLPYKKNRRGQFNDQD